MADDIRSLDSGLSGPTATQPSATPYTPKPAAIADLTASARHYETLPRPALEQLIEQLGQASKEREATWHARAFPVNHPKNYTAVPTPDAKKATDALVRIYNDACTNCDVDLISLAGKARGLNPILIFADMHPAKLITLGFVSIAGVFYAISQISKLGDYLGK
jgi:hypothetical protein